jgi:hypothetical protein
MDSQACVDKTCEFKSFCADGPPLESAPNGCFPQLTSYQVNVNAGFLVTGTSAGSFAAGTTDENFRCRPFPTNDPDASKNRDARLVSRIPLRPYLGQDPAAIVCGQSVTDVYPTWKDSPPTADGYYIDAYNPARKPTDAVTPGQLDTIKVSDMVVHRQEAPQLVEWMQRWTTDVKAPNACIYWGGPIASDLKPEDTDPSQRNQYVRARFRNTQVAFVLAAIDHGPPGASTLHFDVHGGFREEAVVNVPTVEVSAPARIVLGPIDSNRADMITDKAAPFFFVVDQRRLGTGQGGGPTRGQIVRVNPFGLAATNGYLPVYEDYHASNGLFPIQ